ncbi:HEPN domain-containing protein [Streptomyces sp. NPDC002156]
MASSWPPRNITPLRQSLDPLAEWVKNPPPGRTDDERIWLVRFFLVRTCGYLEQVVNEVVKAYIHERSGGLVRTFANSWLTKSKNPSPDNMIDLVGRFDGALQADLMTLLDAEDQRLRREISLLMDRRHKIAHGLNEGLTGSKAYNLYESAMEIADWFLNNFNPHPPIRKQ